MTPIPKSDHTGSLTIGNWRFRSHVLGDHRRLISVVDFFDAMQVKVTQRHLILNQFAEISNHPLANATREFANLAEKLKNPVLFSSNGALAYGYEGETFVEYCKFVLKLRKNGFCTSIEEKNRADVAESIILALANIGIIALIDEATGYQSLRPRDALQILLDKYLRKELAAWAKVFPDEFYIELFRLRGWEWKGMKVNRPQVVGYYTRDIVYERLAPGIVKELESRNPVEDPGRRKSKHHQWLTDDIGHPALAQHLHAVLGLMRASSNWASFRRLIDRAFPRRGETLELPLDDDDNL